MSTSSDDEPIATRFAKPAAPATGGAVAVAEKPPAPALAPAPAAPPAIKPEPSAPAPAVKRQAPAPAPAVKREAPAPAPAPAVKRKAPAPAPAVKREAPAPAPAVKAEPPAAPKANGVTPAKQSALSSDNDSEDDAPLMLRKTPKKTSAGRASFFGAENSAAPAPAKRNSPREATNGKAEAAKKKKSSSSASKNAKAGALKTSAKNGSAVQKKSAKKVIRVKPGKKAAPVRRPKVIDPEAKKWDTLEHGGVMFPPDYEPHRVKMLYDGREVDLNSEEEEVATMFAIMKETDYYTKPTFRRNFWADFKAVLKKSGKHKELKDLDKCDFEPIFEWNKAKKEKEKEEKAKLTTEEKKAIKEQKDATEAKFKMALVDGKQEQVGNFRVEPPGLFRGRGEHPKMGKLKVRVYPRDITINIGKEATVPEVPAMYAGQKWKEVRHDNSVTWLAYWKDPVNSSAFKYVWLAANSGFKTEADLQKYEKARKLKTEIDGIRKNYTALAKSEIYKEAQMGTAMYFIDKLALRAGHEKDEDEADTVGCCNLKVENIMLEENLSIKFDFLGKDSIRYENTVQVEQHIYKNVERFKKKFGTTKQSKKKRPDDQLFCELDATVLNQFLKDLMPGLSVKVFRTFNASVTLDRLLNTEPETSTLVDKKLAHYNSANKEVAILCNHQRAVPKTHEASMQRMTEKKQKAEEELENFKLELTAAEKKKSVYKKLDGSEGKPGAVDVVKGKVQRKQEQINKMAIQAASKEDLKTVALGTSKINYLDPRITVAWCKRNEVPMEKVFNKALLTKFLWAMDVEPDFRF